MRSSFWTWTGLAGVEVVQSASTGERSSPPKWAAPSPQSSKALNQCPQQWLIVPPERPLAARTVALERGMYAIHPRLRVIHPALAEDLRLQKPSLRWPSGVKLRVGQQFASRALLASGVFMPEFES
jgi:hypothetical protein